MALIYLRLRRVVYLTIFSVVIYVFLCREFQEENKTLRGEDIGPIRFRISNIWAWNDDIVFEPPVKSRHLNVAPDHIVASNVSLVEYASTGKREFDVEGLEDYILWFGSESDVPKYNRNTRCKKARTNIFFLKTHFTGSDVITNILNRYGDLNDLIFGIPDQLHSTFNWPSRFQWNFIDTNLLGGALPSILANHARYNREVVKNIMRPDTAFVTILRDPLSVFEATFYNLELSRDLDLYDKQDPLKQFMMNPKDTVLDVLKKRRFKATLNLIKNPMFFDLGLSTTDYHLLEAVRQAIEEIDRQFHLVLIYEHLLESLVLFKRRMCWQIDDILFLKVHLLKDNISRSPLDSRNLTKAIREWNKADVELYQYFNDTFWTMINEEGPEFNVEVEQFKSKLREVEQDCVEADRNGTFTLNSGVTDFNRYFCIKMLKREEEYLDYLRQKQRALINMKKT